jgi:hypothetical protein
MQRELRFGVITIQNVPWPTLAERWQYLDDRVCRLLENPSAISSERTGE